MYSQYHQWLLKTNSSLQRFQSNSCVQAIQLKLSILKGAIDNIINEWLTHII
jgi:hypothetical protein